MSLVFSRQYWVKVYLHHSIDLPCYLIPRIRYIRRKVSLNRIYITWLSRQFHFVWKREETETVWGKDGMMSTDPSELIDRALKDKERTEVLSGMPAANAEIKRLQADLAAAKEREKRLRRIAGEALGAISFITGFAPPKNWEDRFKWLVKKEAEIRTELEGE